MAANNQITNPRSGIPARNTFKVRLPYLYQAKHQNDELKNLGYDYKGKILRKTTSSELSGKCVPMSPRFAAPSKASHTA